MNSLLSRAGMAMFAVVSAWSVALSGVAGSAPGQPADPLAPPANGPRRTTADWAAITDATVHVSPGKTLEKATVVMRGGRIEAVIEGGGAPPAGATVFDGGSLHVYAGLIDAFVEVDAPMPDANAPGAHWNKRVTPQRSALDGTGVDARTARTLREMGFTAAGISPRGGNFRGSGAVVSLAEAPAEASASRPPVYRSPAFQAVSLETTRGARESDRWEGYPDSQMGAIALIRQTLSDADWLAAGRNALGGASGERAAAAKKAGVDAPNCLEHLIVGGGPEARPTPPPPPLLFDVEDELEVLRAGKIAREFKREYLVVGGGVEFRRLEAIKQDGVRLIVPLQFPEAPKVDSIGAAEDVSLRDLMTWEQAPTNPRRLAAAGLTVSLTTSKGSAGAVAGRRRGPAVPGVEAGAAVGDGGGGSRGEGARGKFMENLRKAMRHGLREEAALAMLTTNPAQMLGVSDRLGTVEAGKAANLVVADGPLFAKKTKIRDVWIDGRRHEISSKPSAFEGTWSIALEPGPAKPGAITWEIKKGGDVTVVKVPAEAGEEKKDAPAAPAAAAAQPKAEGAKEEEAKPAKEPGKPKTIRVKARGVRMDDAAGGPGRVSFVFDHDAFGMPGVFTITGMLDVEPLAQSKGSAAVTMRGEGTRADGARFRWTATKAAQPPTEEGKNAKGEKKDDGKEEKGKEDGEDGEDKSVTDVPEKLGLPFGAYAMESLPAAEYVQIRGATIWTGGPQGIIQDGVMLIRDGKIVEVRAANANEPDYTKAITAGSGRAGGGSGDRASGPLVPRVIDARGKHISPGIIDCHSHTGLSKGTNEAGQAVTAEVRIEDITNPDAINWYRQLAGGTTTVNNLHGSANPIGGQNCVNKIRWGVTRPDDMHLAGATPGIKFALGENVKQSNGSEASNRYPKSRMGVEAIIRDRFTAARDYAKAATGGSQPIRRDLELETLAQILDGKRLIHCHSYRQDEILMLCRLAQEFGFKIGTFQHNLEGYKVADEVGRAAIGASLFSDWWAYKVEVQDAIPSAGPIMHDAGVVVSYNSDSDELARRMNVEAGKATKYGGLPPHEALKFVTINPAKQLMLEKQIGSLEAGKDADFVIWSGPPTSSLSRCEATYVDGREYYSLAKDAQLRERDAKERQRIIQKILSEGSKKRGGRGGEEKKEGDKPEPVADAPTDDGARSGRGLLMAEMLRRAADRRREMFLDMYRRGIDPEAARCGDCGESMILEGAAR